MRAADRLNLQHSIYRAAGLLRAALLVLAFVVNIVRVRQAIHPVLLIVATLAMVGWTGAVWVWNQMPARRTLPWMAGDVVFTLLIVGSSRFILGQQLLAQTYLGLAVYWMVCAPVVVGIWKGPVAGALTGLLVGAANFAMLPSTNPRAWLDLVCMIWVPALGGLIADELNKLMKERDQNNALAAGLAERDRLNRMVHDGVLQVLAMVERDGSELGGRGAELAALARDQEVRLRDMLQGRSSPSQSGMVDLAALLARRAGSKVSISSMAGALPVPARVAEELDAAVGEALANVDLHAGPQAKAWILIEDDDDSIVVSVRDNGVGMTSEDVERAAAAGHRGVVDSIKGRLEALGGQATWQSEPGAGVEWEMRVRKEAGDAARE